MPPPLDTALLARESEGIRRLARAILVDADRADDAAQETMRIALETGPRPGISPAAWLRGVLRNVVRRTRRTDARRLARERAAAVPARAPESESLDRLARRKAVLEAVLVLPEALRTAIELRFFEGMPPRAIARRLGIPVETCRSRIRRGLEALRAEFDRREGDDRRRWAFALAPLAFPTRGFEGSVGMGVLLMGTKTKVAAALALVALLGAGALAIRPDRGSDDAVPSAPPPLPAPITADTLAGAGKPNALTTADTATTLPAGTYRVRVTGLVTDVDGQPIEGARVHAGSADRFDDLTREPDSTTDAAGRFVVERTGPDLAWRVQASAPGRRTANVTASAGADRDVVLRLARTVKFWLSVRDAETDLPIEGADIVLIAADEGSRRVERARTDAAGLASVDEPGVRAMGFEASTGLRVSADGRSPASVRFDDGLLIAGRTTRDRPHRVALRIAAPLVAKVVSGTGEPVSHATVFGWADGYGYAGSVSGGTMLRAVEGRAVPLGPVDSDAGGLASVGVGTDHWYLFATRGDDAAFRVGGGAPKAPVELRLTPTISVDGVVVDAHGASVAGANVGVNWFEWMRSSPNDRVPVTPPEMQARFRVRTDADGHFLLPHLPRPPAPRDFYLEAEGVGPSYGGAKVEAAAGAASASVRIVLTRMGDPWAFRIRTSAGAPIPGALVRFPFQYPAARADIDGLASLDVPPEPAVERTLLVEAPGFATRRVSVGAARPTSPVDIALEPEAILELTVRDPAGHPVPGAQVAVVADGTDAEVEAAIGDRAAPTRLAERHTDADGRVHLDGLPRSPIRLAVEVFDLTAFDVKEQDRNRRVVRFAIPGLAEIVLPRAVFDPASGSVVEGELLGEDGLPIAGPYSAALQSAELGAYPAVSTGRRFRFEGIPPGRWQLQIYATESNTPVLADVETWAGRDITDLRVTRTAPARLIGTVVAPGVADLSGFPVEAIDARGLGHVRGRATTRAAGAFEMGDLPPGPCRIVLRAPAAGRLPLVAVDATPVALTAGAEARIEVRAAPAARLVLVCDDPRTNVRPEKMDLRDFHSADYVTNVVLTWSDGHTDTTFGLYRGRNETPWALPAGRYRLRVRRFEEFEREIVVDRTGDVEVRVEFAKAVPSHR